MASIKRNDEEFHASVFHVGLFKEGKLAEASTTYRIELHIKFMERLHMPIRLNLPAAGAMLNPVPEDRRTVGIAPPALQAPTPETLPSSPHRRPHPLLAFARCFGVPGQSSSSRPPTNSASEPSSGREAQLNAALDGWATTQDDIPPSLLLKFKEILHLDTVPNNSVIGLNADDSNLTCFPSEMSEAKALQVLALSGNRLTSFPAEMGQAKALHTINLQNNRLSELPSEIAQLPALRVLRLVENRFTQVPRWLLDLPARTEIDMRGNPLPPAEILAVRQIMAQRRAANEPVPMLLLPPLPGDAGDLREAVANGMNVHSIALTDAFQKRLDDLAKQFPQQLCGSSEAQRAELAAIAQRLTHALDAHAKADPPDPTVLAHARQIAALMFQKGQGEARAYDNDFDRSAGHVLGYTFLALEAQLALTPKAHQIEARRNGMTALITALHSDGEDRCDTRLCEEVMQTIGLPLSRYAEEHKEIIGVAPPAITAAEMRDVTVAVAKGVLREILETSPECTGTVPPKSWRAAVAEKMQQDHSRMLPEQWEPYVREIESMWETFYELVNDQKAAER